MLKQCSGLAGMIDPGPTVLALDVATSTGWAISTGASGAESFALNKRADATLRHGHVAAAFRRWLDSTIDRHEVGLVIMERQAVRGTKGECAPPAQLEVLLGLRAVGLALCHERRVAVVEVTASEWQPWAETALGWEKRRGPEGDRADALAILAWAVANLVHD